MLRSLSGWLFGHTSPARSRRPPVGFRPTLEVLEDRAVPSVYQVTTIADSGPGSLRNAVAMSDAHPGADKIVFAPSLSGRIITLTSGELLVTDDLWINGPGASKLTVSGGGSSRVFEIAAGTTDAISGLTITGGNGLANNPNGATGFDGAGAGILNFGTLSVSRTTLSANDAPNNYTGAGGGIFSFFGASLTVSGSTLSNNFGGFDGGGILNFGPLKVSGTTLSGNTAVSAGGGIFNVYTGTMSIAGCTLSGNSAGDGGGLENDGMGTITGTALSGNHATSLRGGAIANAGTLAVSACALSGNSAAFGGGGIDNEAYATLTVSLCTLSGNSATGFFDPVSGAVAGVGGGIFNEYGATLTLSFCTLSGNSAGFGGAIANYFGATLTVSFCALSGNSASIDGGGIFNSFYGVSGTVYLKSSIFCMNTPDNVVGGFIDQGGNTFC
jgi:hypothetical protein